jgi:hypothetical protein
MALLACILSRSGLLRNAEETAYDSYLNHGPGFQSCPEYSDGTPSVSYLVQSSLGKVNEKKEDRLAHKRLRCGFELGSTDWETNHPTKNMV